MTGSIVVTGCGGLGSAVIARLAGGALPVVVIDNAEREHPAGAIGERCDVRDRAAVTTLLRRYRPVAVVHTAGLVGDAAKAQPALAESVNVGGTATVAAACADTGVPRLVITSSLAVYGTRLAAGPAEDAPPAPRSHYGRTKLAAELVAATAVQDSSTALVAMRLAGLYGGRDGQGGWMNAGLDAMLRAGAAGHDIDCAAPATGREHLHVDDAADAVRLAALRAADPPVVVNVGAGRLDSVWELAAVLRELLPAVTVRARPEPGGVDRPLDITLASRVLGYRPLIGLAAGLRRMLERLRASSQVTR